MKNISIFLLFFLSFINLQGQNAFPSKNPGKFPKDSVSIRSKFTKNNNLIIFLMNRTKDTISFISDHQYNISIGKEVLDENKQWVKFDQDPIRKPSCLSGIKILKIPTDYYTYQVYENEKYAGDFKTKMRFSLRVNDSTIVYSKNLDISVNKELILPPELRLNKILEQKYAQEKSIEKKYVLLKQMIQNYNDFNLMEKSVLLCKNWKEDEFLEKVNAHYHITLSKFLNANPGLDKYHKTLILCKYLELFQNSFLKSNTEKLESYRKLLPTREEWEEIKGDCKSKKCYEDLIIKDFVEIQFK
ncbi:hypothetical protein [Aureivirga sp. CE67]|uniref:hypothetical protein n=1 Tax=Aureivirga sp. CE67 TaxID=1788983 RepID=UPI0018CB58AB|nr:hypothetical protein [Aureivirga sp. CE67]